MSFGNEDLRKDFPILDSYIYLDNASTTQKPMSVIDGVSDFVKTQYSNIHRGTYALSEVSEDLYHESKSEFSNFVQASGNPIFYSYNATYCINQIALSLLYGGVLGEGDTIMVGRWEHHANLIPRIELANKNNIRITYIELDAYGQIDLIDFQKKYDSTVKVVAFSMYSNVLGHYIIPESIYTCLGENTFLLVDGSQLIPHKEINFNQSRIDCLVATGHKMLAYTGIGMAVIKKKRIGVLSSSIFGGGIVNSVTEKRIEYVQDVSKLEAGTPNIIGAVSLLLAINYINSIGGIKRIQDIEMKQRSYCLERFIDMSSQIKLIDHGYVHSESKGNVFSFTLKSHELSLNLVTQQLASKNICVRTGGHCAHPIHESYGVNSTIRVSTYFYNTEEDIDIFFNELKRIIE